MLKESLRSRWAIGMRRSRSLKNGWGMESVMGSWQSTEMECIEYEKETRPVRANVLYAALLDLT